jgi:hypothetical protein
MACYDVWTAGAAAGLTEALAEEQRAREQRTESREQRAESREQRAESREQRAESREQRCTMKCYAVWCDRKCSGGTDTGTPRGATQGWIETYLINGM